MSDFDFEAWMKEKEKENLQLDISRNQEAISTTTASSASSAMQEEFTSEANDEEKFYEIKNEEKFFSFNITEEQEFGDTDEAIGQTSTYKPTSMSDEVPDDIDDADTAEKAEDFPTTEMGGLGAFLLFLWTSGIIPILAYIAVGSVAALLLLYWVVMVPSLSINQRLAMVKSVLFQSFMCLLFPIRNTRVGKSIINYFQNAEVSEAPEAPDVVVVGDPVKPPVPQTSPGRRLHPKSLKPRLYPTLPTIDEALNDVTSDSGSKDNLDAAASNDGDGAVASNTGITDGNTSDKGSSSEVTKVKDEPVDISEQVLDQIKVEADEQVEIDDISEQVVAEDQDKVELDEQVEQAALWNRYRALVDDPDSDIDVQSDIVMEEVQDQNDDLVDEVSENQSILLAGLQDSLSNWDTHLQVGKVSHTF